MRDPEIWNIGRYWLDEPSEADKAWNAYVAETKHEHGDNWVNMVSTDDFELWILHGGYDGQ